VSRTAIWLPRLLEAQERGEHAVDVATRYNVSRACVSQACKQYGITLAPKPKRKRNWAAILADAQARDITAADLARELNLTVQAVRARQSEHGVTLRLSHPAKSHPQGIAA
jgi:hypothetical protein